MKVIVFGLGKFFENRKKQLMSFSNVDIVAYTDNNRYLWGNVLDGIQVVAPEKVMEVHYDAILIMSTYAEEIYEQLIRMGVAETKIRYWEFFCSELVSGTKEIFSGKSDDKSVKDKILIITTDLNYDGGSLAAIYAALALKNKGYEVNLASPSGDDRLIAETTDKGITIYICPSLPYIYEAEEIWVKQFDMVIVNVFQMIQSVLKTGLFRPTLWWIHEPIGMFHYTRTRHWNRVQTKDLDNISIYAVSRIPRENFNDFYPHRIQKILHYGIPDMKSDDLMSENKKTKIVFAVIGRVGERKAQDIFCKAVIKMLEKELAEFWIIGYYGEDTFSEEIYRMSVETKSIKMLGLLTREEIYNIFPRIDIVVCTSREDPLPIVMTEGMMFGKVCITTDTTGTADFIQNGENGFIIPSDNVDALRERMEWILNNKDKLAEIGMRARETYEKYFTMEVFGENLENALIETKEEWNLKRE